MTSKQLSYYPAAWTRHDPFYARTKGYKIFCLIFDYGQRHRKEILQAVKLAKAAQSEYKIVRISLPWGGSALLDKKIPLPRNRENIRLKFP